MDQAGPTSLGSMISLCLKSRKKIPGKEKMLKDTNHISQEWGNIKTASQYAGVCERTLEDWLKEGLKFVRLPSGHRLIRFEWIDLFLEQYIQEPGSNPVDQITQEIFNEMKI